METERKAKVVASVWGGKICSIPCSVYLEETVENSLSIWKKRLNSNISFKSTETKQLAQQGIEHILPTKPMRRPLPCLLFSSFFSDLAPGYPRRRLQIPRQLVRLLQNLSVHAGEASGKCPSRRREMFRYSEFQLIGELQWVFFYNRK